MTNFQVKISGWRVGAQKVRADQTIREHSALDLAEAKSVVDEVLRGESVLVAVDSERDAFSLAASLQSLEFEAVVERR